MADVVRVAMWSGPRNISTALLRSFEVRPDTVVVDEPLYAHYLRVTAADHPGREEVIAAHESDWRSAVRSLLAPVPSGIAVQYQKHMAHHLLPMIERSWFDQVSHAFLIRHPAEMLASLAKVLARPTLEDTGLPQQVEIYEAVSQAGTRPPVIDARDVLLSPAAMLRSLCTALGITFDERMLSWPAGPRDSDGVWGRWWYDAVYASTGFAPYRAPADPLPRQLRPLLDQCLPYYERLYRERITD